MEYVNMGYEILGLIIIRVRFANICKDSDSKTVNFATVEPLRMISIDFIWLLPTYTAPIIFPPTFS